MAEPARGGGDGGPLDDPFQEAMRHVREAWTAESENFDNGRDDQRFYAGEQWLPDAQRERTLSGRPSITVNRVPSFVRQVTGDVRRDTPSVKVVPAKDGASQETAEVYNGLIRNIEQQSNAKAAYVQGVENACITGLGAFQVVTQYSADDAFEQDIRIKRHTDPFSVLFDPAAREPDKSDGRYAFVFIDMPKETFRTKFPNKISESMPAGPNSIQGLAWFSLESVRVAEYWYRKPVKKKLLLLADGRVLEAKQSLEEAQVNGPLDVVDKRTVDTTEVCMRLMSGAEFLTAEQEWAGKYIPVIPVIGEEIFIEGRVLRKGLVRDVKDPQRVYNYMRTAAVEAAALQPKAPFIVTADMIKGRENMWNTSGSKNWAALVYTPDGKAPGAKPERSPPPLAQAGLDSQAEISADDMKAVTGIYDASLGAKSNETSGRAILARQREGDTGTYHFIDNLATSIRHCGQILVDLIPKIYDTPRIVRILKEDGIEHDMVPINQQFQTGKVDELGQAILQMHDMAVGEYDVIVITGPSFATRREESLNAMTDVLKAWPQGMAVFGDIFFKNTDFPGASEIAKRVERTIPPQLKDDTPPAPPPPDPEKIAKALDSAASADLKHAQAAKAMVEADVLANSVGLQVIEAITPLLQSIMQGQQTQQQPEGGQSASQEPPAPELEPMAGAPNGQAGAPQLEPITPQEPPA